MTIDYDLMNAELPRCKAALTRATKSGDPVKILDAVEKALDLFDRVGAMPDAWSVWRNALEDGWNIFRRSDAYDDDLYDNGAKIITRFQTLTARF